MDEKWQEIIGTILFVALMVFVFAIQRNPYEEPEEVKPEYISGMPCEDSEAYRIWEEWYEQATEAKIEESGRTGDVERTSAERFTADYTVNCRSRTIVKGSIAESSTVATGADASGDTGITEGEINEQAASEEIRAVGELPNPEVADVCEQGCETSPEMCTEIVQDRVTENPAVETVQAVQEPEQVQAESYVQCYSNEDLLRFALRDAGIEWWYPYAWAQAMQESRWNPNAVSPDGLDYGLFQFRLKSPDGTRMYWTEPESIFDVNAQIRVYTERVAARIAAGLSIEEIISRHFTSDYVTEINWQYVNDVLQHLN